MKHWIAAARLRTLPLALASIFMGSFLAYAHGQFDWLIFFLTVSTTIALQILSNYANDLGDTQNGADLAGRVGPSRAVQSGIISLESMKKAVILMVIVSLVSGISLLWFSFYKAVDVKFWAFLGLGLLAIFAAITYTAGSKPYGYSGFGDISVFIFFGLVAVLGSYFLQTKQINLALLLPAASTGLFAVNVLNINNMRDIASDKKAGKFTLPVRLGLPWAVLYHRSIIVLGLVLAIIYVLLYFSSPYQFLFLLVSPLFYNIGQSINAASQAQYIDTFLKKMAISALIFSVLFGLGQILG